MTTPNDQPPASPSPVEPAGTTARIVKRYTNRKLYDTVESRYVTLPQIADLLRQGQDVRIIDNTSKEDLTSVTLAQILYEEERRQSRALPLAALKDLIHASGERLMTSLREGPVGKLIGRVDGAAEAPTPASPPPPAPVPVAAEAAEPGRVQQFVEHSREALDQWQHRVDERVKAVWETINPAAQIQVLQAEVRRLSQRIEVLEAREPTAPPGAGTPAHRDDPSACRKE